MNLATFRTRISGAIGISNIASSPEQALIDGWVNEGIVDLLRRTKMVKKTASLTLTANVGDYELDADILSFKSLTYEPATSNQQSWSLEPLDSADIRRMRLFQAAASVNPTYYALEGVNLLMLYPTPSSSTDKVHMLYTPRPAALALTGDDPSTAGKGQIPSEFHPAIEEYAKWKAADYVDDASSQQGMAYFQGYQQWVVEIMKSTTLKGGVGLPGITWGKRGLRFPWTPGTDIGA